MTDSLAHTDSGPRSPAPGEDVLVARGVRKQFGDFVAVNDLSFEVRRGEIFALLGPNGAGKTTLLRMALDILKPDAGTLLLFGRPPATDLKRRIGYLPEERGLYRKQKLRAVLEYLARLKGLDGRASRARVSGLLERVGLADRAEQKIGELSKGMQQKVQFCGALVGRPELLVLDEPFAGLDPVNTRLLEDVLEEERGRGATIVLCTHQMAKVEQICDRALVIHKGRAVLHGSVEELIRHHSPEAYLVRTRGVLDGLPGVDRVEREMPSGAGAGTAPATPVQRVVLKRGAVPRPFLNALVAIDEPVESFARERVPLEEIFVQVVESSGEDVRGLLAESRRADRVAEASSV